MTDDTQQAPVTNPPPAAPAPRPKPERKPTKPRRSASWQPDPRWAHPLEFALWVYSASYLTHLGVPAAAVAVLGLACGGIAALRARTAFPRVDYGDQLPTQLTTLAVVSGAAAAIWLWHAGRIGPLDAIGWLAIAAVPLGLVYAVLRSSAPKWAQRVDEIEQARAEQDARDTWEKILADVGLKLKVVDIRTTRAGFAIGVSPSTERAVPLSELRGRVGDLTTRASMLLAREGTTVRDGDIRVEGTEASHVHVIHVCTNHVLEHSIPFVPLGHPGTAEDPVDPALYEDGRELDVSLVGPGGAVHGLIVGASGSGKTTATQSFIGRYAETVDVIQGVIASDKLVPLVWPWVRPYAAGECNRPGLDFAVGQNPAHVMEFLAGLYLLMRDRNRRLPDSGIFPISPEEPGIILWVEETSDLIDRTGRIMVEGRAMTFSMLMEGFTRASRSAQIAVEMLNQFALVEKFGDRGSEIFRNCTFRVALRTMSSYDGTATLPGLQGLQADTTKLQHQSMLVQPSTEDPRVMPAKAYCFADGEIGAHSIAVSQHRPGLSEHEAGVIGEPWAQRWSAERCPELVARAAAEDLAWPGNPDPAGGSGETPVRREEDDVDRELREMLEGESADASPAVEPTEPDPGVGGLPSAEQAIEEIRRATANVGRPVLPEPLQGVMEAIEGSGTTAEFVSTRQLAIWTERCAPDADDDVLDAAAVELGRQLAEVDEELRTRQRRVKGVGRSRGYDVAELRRIAARIARGSQ